MNIKQIVEKCCATAPRELAAEAVEAAIVAARSSPCAKSRRGAAVFLPRAVYSPMCVYGVGFNGQSPPWRCGGSCARTHATGMSECSMLCEHAEARAIRHGIVAWAARHAGVTMRDEVAPAPYLAGLDLVHIKVDADGMPVASGGPSCWQCSRTIVDVGISGVWLFEVHQPHDLEPRWIRYTGEAFHALTLQACGLDGHANDQVVAATESAAAAHKAWKLAEDHAALVARERDAARSALATIHSRIKETHDAHPAMVTLARLGIQAAGPWKGASHDVMDLLDEIAVLRSTDLAHERDAAKAALVEARRECDLLRAQLDTATIDAIIADRGGAS